MVPGCNVLAPADFSSSHRSVLRYIPLVTGLEEVSMDTSVAMSSLPCSMESSSPWSTRATTSPHLVSLFEPGMALVVKAMPNSNNHTRRWGAGPSDSVSGGGKLQIVTLYYIAP